MSLEWFQAVGWPFGPFTCMCGYDIPRSDCCTCGAHDRAEQYARFQAKTMRQEFRSLEFAWWAFGIRYGTATAPRPIPLVDVCVTPLPDGEDGEPMAVVEIGDEVFISPARRGGA